MIRSAIVILFAAIAITMLDIKELIIINTILTTMVLYIALKNLIEKEDEEKQC